MIALTHLLFDVVCAFVLFFLRFSHMQQWIVKPTVSRGEAEGWMTLKSALPTRPELSRGTWRVLDGNEWASQPTVSILTVEQRRKEDQRLGAARRAQAVPVDIRGATGPYASKVNGIYEPTDELCGGWPVYRKRGGPDIWLEYTAVTNQVRYFTDISTDDCLDSLII